jgi:hypothetical protein
MRNTLLLPITFALFLFPCFAQKNATCPQIKVISPDGKFMPGDEMPFSVSLGEEAKNLNLEYVWEISNGEIIKGQGTTAIIISTAGLAGTPVVTTVEIKGLPQNCANKFSGRSFVNEKLPFPPPPVHECEIPESDEPLDERLDKLAIQLLADKDSKAFIKILFKNKNERKNLNRIYDYLTKNRKIAEDRIEFGIYKKTYCSKIILFIVPKGAGLPECENCEIIKGVVFRAKKSSQ